MSQRSSESWNLLFQMWTRPFQMNCLSLHMWLLTITLLPGWWMRWKVVIALPKWVHHCMGLTVGFVVKIVNACSTNVSCCVQRLRLMRGKWMCNRKCRVKIFALMKWLSFLYFCSVLWSDVHHIGGTYCLHLQGD